MRVQKNRTKMSTVNGPKKEIPQSSCYFCNEVFENGQLQVHLTQCGSILEQCPLRCGAWIQRRHKEKHITECPTMATAASKIAADRRAAEDRRDRTWKVRSVPISDCVSALEKEVEFMRVAIIEESRQRQLQLGQLENLNSKFTLSEERNQHFLTSLLALRGSVEEEARRANDWCGQMKHDIGGLHVKFAEIQNEVLEVRLRLDGVCSSVLHEQNERELLEQIINSQDSRLKALHVSEKENIEYLVNLLRDEQQQREAVRAAIEGELAQIRHTLNEEQNLTSHVLNEQINNITLLRGDLEHRSRSSTSEVLDKHQILDVEVKNMKQVMETEADKIERMQKEFKALSKSYLKLRQEFNDFRNTVAFSSENVLSDTSGHLMWKIEEYVSKMKDAKEHDTTLYSPVFRTSQYGYTLQAEVSLNGVGKWRGRHLTATVSVLRGPYDALLEWPCDLRVNIIFKDQAIKRAQAIDIVKMLQIKKSTSKRSEPNNVDSDDKSKSSDGKKSATESSGRSTPDTLAVPSGSKDTTEPRHSAETAAAELARSKVQHSVQLKKTYVFIPHTTIDKLEYIKNNVMFIEIKVTQ